VRLYTIKIIYLIKVSNSSSNTKLLLLTGVKFDLVARELFIIIWWSSKLDDVGKIWNFCPSLYKTLL